MTESELVFEDQAAVFDEYRDRKNSKYLRILIHNGDAIKTLVRKMTRYAEEKNLPLEAIRPTNPTWPSHDRLKISFKIDPDYLETIALEKRIAAGV